MERHLHEEAGIKFRVDLLSSWLGQQLVAEILQHNTTDEEDHTTTKSCLHPVFTGMTCTKCGEQNNGTISTVPFWYIYADLNISTKEIDRIRDINFKDLITRRKLHLVIDLDHTLVHTRKSYKLSPEDRKFLGPKKNGVDYSLRGEVGSLFRGSDGWTKLRPYVRDFLRQAYTLFDMTIYTLGGKDYAWNMSKLLDPNGVCFNNWRVVSREDCVALDKHKKTLDVILEHERVVVVMDDNEDVWEDHKMNLFKVKPYNYFHYFSPEDRVHDASPPRLSWSQLNGDESEENGELARALDKLRAVHAAFFDDSSVKRKEDYDSLDVRQVLQRVFMKPKPLTKKQKKHKAKKINVLSRAPQAARI